MTSPLFPGLVGLGFFLLFKKLRFQQDNNDTTSSIVSLPAAPTSLSQNQTHHVFPSFHGADVRKSILSHILASFNRKGIFPFNDNGIDRGNSIGPELIKAIRSSKIAIVLLSKNYASSSWCLNELAEIIECKEKRKQIVMPIFYEVDPSDIKKQAGDFGKAFKKTCKGRTKEDIEKWRKALEEVATIAGEHSRNWSNEANMIEKIATDVLNKLTNSKPSQDLEYYVGMRAHMERMLSLLSLNSDEVRMIGIWGPPGIGKTTIARVLFHQLSSSFQLSTIMVDVKGCFPRPCFDEYNVQLQLQNRMLCQITNHKELKISHLGVAPELLEDKKVLLVIDEVDHLKQLDALAENKSWFGSGSRIIVTTEDRSLLKAHDIDHIYEVECPSWDEAFQIFCMHAFRKNRPPDDGFYKLAKEVSNLAGKLPLGLKVLGSALRGKSKQEWEMILPRLKTSLDGEIESIIKFSYDALCDEDKYLFLYLSCFFIEELTQKVEELLANQFPNVKLGLNILTEKSLVFIYGIYIDDYDERIGMHGLVRQFGRETARKKFVRNGITKRELLVDERDICEMLTEDTTTDNNHLIAINLTRNRIEKNIDISDKTLKKMADLQFIRVFDISPPSVFFHSQKIRSLQWLHFGNICLPSTFNTEFLVNLDLLGSKLQKLWEGDKVLKNLKWMDLTWSKHLKELPDLSTATKLEVLNLSVCRSLLELPDLSTATKLRKLDLFLCSSLVKLPSSIGDLINLEEIILEGCSSLVEIPFSIGNLQKLKKLRMEGCSKLEALPTNINLESLSHLYVINCSQLKSFPEISTNIEQLYFTGAAINEIPLTIVLWPRLWKLNLHDCNNLVSLPQFPDSLKYLDAGNCKSLERLNCTFNNPEIKLLFSNCFKLNKEARDIIINTTCKYAELPGTEVPACFNYCRSTGGGIKLNESTHPTSLRFKVCTTVVNGDEETSHGENWWTHIEMMVKQNDHIIPCRSSAEYIDTDISDISCLRKQIYIFEVAFEVEEEEVTFTELVLELQTENPLTGRRKTSKMWKIREWGLMKI